LPAAGNVQSLIISVEEYGGHFENGVAAGIKPTGFDIDNNGHETAEAGGKTHWTTLTVLCFKKIVSPACANQFLYIAKTTKTC